MRSWWVRTAWTVYEKGNELEDELFRRIDESLRRTGGVKIILGCFDVKE